MHVLTGVFANRMLHRFVLQKQVLRGAIEAAFVGVQARLVMHVVLDDTEHGFLIGNGDMERANTATALHKRDDRALIFGATRATRVVGTAFSLRRYAGLFHLAEIGFVGLDNTAAATHRRQAAVAHSLTDAMRHEP